MEKILFDKKPFSKSGSFILYDWKNTKDDFYFGDKKGNLYFFIKSENPKKILEDVFLKPFENFEFGSGCEVLNKYEGEVENSDLKYLFAEFELPRTPKFNWKGYPLPIKRDVRLSHFDNENEIMKYLSRYIDNN